MRFRNDTGFDEKISLPVPCRQNETIESLVKRIPKVYSNIYGDNNSLQYGDKIVIQVLPPDVR